MAQREGVQIHKHDVIYRFLDGVKAVMSELLPTEKKETVVGQGKTLEVRLALLHPTLGHYFACVKQVYQSLASPLL